MVLTIRSRANRKPITPREARNSRHSAMPKAKCANAPDLRLPNANWTTGTAIMANRSRPTSRNEISPKIAGPASAKFVGSECIGQGGKKPLQDEETDHGSQDHGQPDQ